MAKNADGLNPKQERFVSEYLVDLNATQAAIRAGYSAKTARHGGAQLLANINISTAVAERLRVSTAKAYLTVERLDQEVARIATADIRKLYDEAGNVKPISEWDDDTAAAVSGLEVNELWEGHGEDREQTGLVKKFKTWDKNAAISLGYKRLGVLKEGTQVNVSVTLEALVAASMPKAAAE